jgi:DNA ligase (NAD+)
MVEYCKGDTSLDTINNIINTLPHIWTEMKDCGVVVANSIYKWFNDKNNLEMLSYLTQMELTFIEDKPKEITQGIFTGKSLYATGTFANYKKNELKEIIESNGGIFANGYSKSLSYLVVGSVKGSSKEDKAKKDGITILTEDEFLQIIKGN